MGNVFAEIGKALGKAVLTGLGLELARLSSERLRARFGIKDLEAEKRREDLERIKRENDALRLEVERLRTSQAVDNKQVSSNDASGDRTP